MSCTPSDLLAPFCHDPPTITAGIRVKDGGAHVRPCLDGLRELVNDIVVLDDGSTDDTVSICRAYPKVTRLLSWPKTFFHEGMDRTVVLALMADTGADWFLTMDVDEVFEGRAREVMPRLAADRSVAVWEFRLFDFWGSRTHYRVGGVWADLTRGGHRGLYRNQPGLHYPLEKIHCSGILGSAGPVTQSNLRIKHYGYADLEEAACKLRAYEEASGWPHLQLLVGPITVAEWREEADA